MILNQNGTEIRRWFKDRVINIINYTIGGSFSFVDVITGRNYTLNESIIGICYDNGFLVIKNEKSTYCCVAL